jgi:peptide/nickel transport system ATP-binding protein
MRDPSHSGDKSTKSELEGPSVPLGSESRPLLAVEDLKTHFFTRAGVLRAVDGASFSVDRGQIMGLVGESGSGKSVTAFSIMGVVDYPGRIVSGSILFDGNELVNMEEEQFRTLRGRRIAMIFQDPMMTLNPVLRIDRQIIESIRAHDDIDWLTARAHAREALVQVGISAPDERLRSYPHQLSGGMRQRVVIAIALLHQPDLIIADEPTTALDVTIQAQILFEVQKLVRERGTALIWITHDLSVVSGLADQVCVMYAGKIVERGPIAKVIRHPLHPYTQGLIGSIPSRNVRGKPLAQIPGSSPSLLNLPEGCPFRPRCPRASENCLEMPKMELPLRGREVRCIHPLLNGEECR